MIDIDLESLLLAARESVNFFQAKKVVADALSQSGPSQRWRVYVWLAGVP
jgi:hypothetical protein